MMKENVPWMPGLYVSVDGDIFELRNNNWGTVKDIPQFIQEL